MTTWVLVADRTSARVYERKANNFELLRRVEHPEGRKVDQDRESGLPARTYDRHAEGRAAPDRGTSLAQRTEGAFAKDLAVLLEQGRTRFGVTHIVLVAEPHLLGILREGLDPRTASLVVESVTKDLHAVPDRDVPRHLDGI